MNCVLGWILVMLPILIVMVALFMWMVIDSGWKDASIVFAVLFFILAGVSVMAFCIEHGIKLLETCK